MSGRLIDPFKTQVIAPARYVMLRRGDEDQRVHIFAEWLKAACKQFVNDRRAILNLA
ncbi:hypothetical protein D3C71_2206750 [compost metagenome]